VIVLLLGGKVIAITFLVVPLTLFWLVPTVWAVHRIAPDLRFGYRGARRSMARQVTIFGSALFGIQVAQVVKLNSDELVIGAVKSVKAVAPYNVAARLSNIPSALTNQFIYVLLPIASRLHAEGEEWLLREVYLSGIRLTIALFSIVGIPVIVFASPFLSSWISPTVASSGGIAVTLTVAGLLEAVMAPASQALQGMNRHRPLVIFALGSAALNLGLSLALIGPLGVRGVAFGTLIATSLQALVTLPFAGRVVGVSLAQVARKVLLPGLLPVIPAAAVLVLLRHTLAPASVLTIALAGGAGAVVYIGCYLLMPASASERAMANQLVGRVRRLLAH
jgi:O-antigen/teichoic acid export membrane protein